MRKRTHRDMMQVVQRERINFVAAPFLGRVIVGRNDHLESKLLEEVLRTVLVLHALALVLLSVSRLEDLLELLQALLGLSLLDGRLVHHLSEIHVVELVTGRHDVVEVDELDERFDLGALQHSLFFHRSGDLSRVAIDTGNCRRKTWVN